MSTDVSMDAIAAQARVSKGTLYNHFESKEDLLIAMVESRLQASSELVDLKVGTAVEPSLSLERTVEGLLDVIVQQAESASLLYQTWFLVSGDEVLRTRFFGALTQFFDQWTASARETFAAGQATGVFGKDADPDGFADAMVAQVSGFIFRSAFDPTSMEPDRLRAAFRALLHQRVDAHPEPFKLAGDVS